ncbi:MAG: helix-hairpin-helix domain-containing protein [Scytolyngbya sp. HA4215-MV1]|nr:helix-hairpin-helix domain-containing protein [Scytolyngbya sp. HA4215-MV1]
MGGVSLAGLAACQAGQPEATRPTPLPQDPLVEAYTNHDPAFQYTEPYRKITRPGTDLEQKIVDLIASAQSSVEVAVQELRLPKIAQALIDRQKAGVKVRVILENTYSRPFSSFTAAEIAKLPEREQGRYKEAIQLIDINGDGQLSPDEINQRDALVMLRNAKVPWIDDTADGSEGSSLMHDKFVVVDGRQVIVTSANFTTSDIHGDFKSPSSRGNANNLLKIDSAEVASLFTQEFNVMWGDGPGGKLDSKFGVKKPFLPVRQVILGATTIEVHFSPTNATIPWSQSSNGLIGKTLSTAQRSIEMALFVFSDQTLVNQLEVMNQRGVQIRTLIDPGFAYRPFSEGLDMLGVALADNCKSEPNNRPWQSPIATVGVPRLPPGDLLHNKFGVIDRQTVITGSHNWTAAANNANDETVLVIHSPIVAAHYEREFERLYTNAILGVPPAIARKAEKERSRCPMSGATNPTAAVRSATPITSPQKTNLPTASTPMTQPPKHSQKARSQAPTTPSQRVNLNTASQAELEALPGVGPGLAKRIIAARQHKPFTSLADLDQVSGVGPKLLKKLEDHVTW